jgi:hypothetical protein
MIAVFAFLLSIQNESKEEMGWNAGGKKGQISKIIYKILEYWSRGPYHSKTHL